MAFAPCMWLAVLLTLQCGSIAATEPALDEGVILAFHITVDGDQVSALPRFLGSLYHPQNLYLVDFVKGAEPSSDMSSEIPEDASNVHSRVGEDTVPGGVSEVLLTLSAMAYFADWEDYTDQTYTYFLNTSPDEYPTVQPDDLRLVLATASKRYSMPINFMYFADEKKWESAHYDYDTVHYDPSLVFTKNETALKSLLSLRQWHPDRHYRTSKVAYADRHMILSSRVARYATESLRSKKLLASLAETRHAHEHFFATLVHEIGHVAGQWDYQTCLRCPELASAALSTHSTPNEPRALSADFVLKRACIFTPVTSRNHVFMQVRDVVDATHSSNRTQIYATVKGLMDMRVKLLSSAESGRGNVENPPKALPL